MITYQAKETTAGNWKFTQFNDDKEVNPNQVASAIGHCANGNCEHKTAIEAANCYRSFQLDTQLKIELEAKKERDCAVCGEKTNMYAETDIDRVFLCDEHNKHSWFESQIPWDENLFYQRMPKPVKSNV